MPPPPQCSSRFPYTRSSDLDHVVEQDGSLSPDIADDLHDFRDVGLWAPLVDDGEGRAQALGEGAGALHAARVRTDDDEDRKSTRLNSSHANISYAVFCLKQK